jgi:hypothetical protein
MKSLPPEPTNESFLGYASVATLASLPFLLFLIGFRRLLDFVGFVFSIKSWHLLAVVAFLLAAGVILLLATMASGPRNEWRETLRKSVDYFPRCTFFLYGLLPVGFAIFSLRDDPCQDMVMPAIVGYDTTISAPYALCSRILTVSLGLSVSVVLVASVIFLKTNSQRWRLLKRSLLAWLILAFGAGVSSYRACDISHSANANNN